MLNFHLVVGPFPMGKMVSHRPRFTRQRHWPPKSWRCQNPMVFFGRLLRNATTWNVWRSFPKTHRLHPGRLTWNIIMEVWKIIFLSKWVICRFHVNLPGCSTKKSQNTPPKIFGYTGCSSGITMVGHATSMVCTEFTFLERPSLEAERKGFLHDKAEPTIWYMGVSLNGGFPPFHTPSADHF